MNRAYNSVEQFTNCSYKIHYQSQQSERNFNDELFADIERSCTMNVSSDGSDVSSDEDLVDMAIDRFSDSKLILPKEQPDIHDHQLTYINEVFSNLSTEMYENNQRRKRKTISDIESHNFVVQTDRIEADKRTTVMVKNIPNKYTIQMLKELIDRNHDQTYDFLYLPIDFKNKCNMGYAFINFIDSKIIAKFHQEFHGQKWPHFNSEKICQLRYARIQGRLALLQHFQFSSVMNQKDKKLKPVIVPQQELQRIQEMIQLQKQ